MYAVAETPYGFKITIADRVTVEEASAVLEKARVVLQTCPKPFGVLVDIRNLRPLSKDVQALVDETQRLHREAGLRRSVVVLASAVMTLQFTEMAKSSGVKAHERYIDASDESDWERVALAWIVDGAEPAAP